MNLEFVTGPKKQLGTVVRKIVLAEKIVEVDIELPTLQLFKPGQYVSLKVTEMGERRSYSVASCRERVITLLVDVGPGGKGSSFIESLGIGDKVEVMGFLGNFCLDRTELVDKSIVYFVATGTGIAPFLPMLEELRTFYKGKVNLWWGVRFVRRVYWQDLLEDLRNEWESFDYLMYVSRPEVRWGGEVGRVGDKLDEVDIKNTSWYLCGATEMVEQMKRRLVVKGINEDDINYEKFF